jgi:LSU ribosomal protein L24P
MDKNFAEREVPIHISNVMVICPHCKKPARLGRRSEEDHKRYCRKCGKDID